MANIGFRGARSPALRSADSERCDVTGSRSPTFFQGIKVLISDSTRTQGKMSFLPERPFLVSKSNIETAKNYPSISFFNGNSVRSCYCAFAPHQKNGNEVLNKFYTFHVKQETQTKTPKVLVICY